MLTCSTSARSVTASIVARTDKADVNTDRATGGQGKGEESSDPGAGLGQGERGGSASEWKGKRRPAQEEEEEGQSAVQVFIVSSIPCDLLPLLLIKKARVDWK